MSKCLNHYSYEYVRMHFHQMTADDEEMEEKEEERFTFVGDTLGFR